MAPPADELPRNRFWLKCAIVLVVLIALGFGAAALYRRWEPARLTKQARAYFDKGDYSNAVLTVRRALQINPLSEPASRLMAELTERLQMPETVDWRQRLTELRPQSATDAFAWAAAALQARRPAAAEQALAAVPEAERNSARYHSLAGTTAVSTGRIKDAREHFEKAVAIEPANELYQYNLATLQIQSATVAERETGSRTLERLAKGGTVELFARRSLISRLTAENKRAEALKVSEELQKSASATFVDRITGLDLAFQVQHPAWQASLADLQKRARSEKPEDVAALLTWMKNAGKATDALQWAETLEATVASHQRVAAARADCYVATGNWPALRSLVEKGNWKELEYLRFAYFARALREEGDSPGARARWSSAISAAGQREPLSQLAWLASQWKWTSELQDALWAAANTPAPQWALQMLHRSYLAEGDTASLLRVAQKAAEVDPQNDAARNNVASLSVLLHRDLDRARDTARALYEKTPDNPIYATTYALALHETGRSADGLAILRKLRPEALKTPTIAAYYGILLATNGAGQEAREYLALAKDAPLLPEEKRLVAAASGPAAH